MEDELKARLQSALSKLDNKESAARLKEDAARAEREEAEHQKEKARIFWTKGRREIDEAVNLVNGQIAGRGLLISIKEDRDEKSPAIANLTLELNRSPKISNAPTLHFNVNAFGSISPRLSSNGKNHHVQSFHVSDGSAARYLELVVCLVESLA
jgi:hypothetical protein